MAKAITICQPYADLIARGEKRVENRTWPTSYRGTLYIHAGKSLEWLCLDKGEKPPAGMVFGAIVAIATLRDCLHIDRIERREYDRKYPWLREHEHTNGEWCWVLDTVSPIGPWPWRGARLLWDIDEDELGSVANKVLGIPEPEQVPQSEKSP